MIFFSLYYTDKPGGFCKRLYRLLNALAARNHTVFYFTLDPELPSSLSETVRIKKIPFPFKARRGIWFWSLFSLWCPFFMTAVFLKYRPNCAVAFSPYYSAMLALTRLVSKAPIVVFLRSLTFKTHEITSVPGPLQFFSDILDRAGVSLACKVVCMTEAMSQEAQAHYALPPEKITVLPNDLPQIKEEQIRRPDNPPRTFLTAGVLDQRKNISLLVEVFHELQQSAPESTLIVAGDGPLRQALESRASSNVQFRGWVSDMRALYQGTDLILHPALHEGVPNVILEGLASGIPVMAARIPELREILDSDDLLFDPNDPRELLQKLKKLLHKRDEFDKIAELSRLSASKLRFDWDEQVATIICDVLSGKVL